MPCLFLSIRSCRQAFGLLLLHLRVQGVPWVGLAFYIHVCSEIPLLCFFLVAVDERGEEIGEELFM